MDQLCGPETGADVAEELETVLGKQAVEAGCGWARAAFCGEEVPSAGGPRRFWLGS